MNQSTTNTTTADALDLVAFTRRMGRSHWGLKGTARHAAYVLTRDEILRLGLEAPDYDERAVHLALDTCLREAQS